MVETSTQNNSGTLWIKQPGPTGRAIALMLGHEEVAANAYLFAAAPDLFDACKRALDEAEDGLTFGCTEDLKDAIAKAEGAT
jgi:mannose/cellobiose epimerase-like protein (N-acyl-D-glucosamine 2-epimerase family)